MRSAFLVVASIALVACAPATPTSAPAPATAPASAAPTTPAAPAAGLREATRDWHLLDPATDRVNGIGLLRAERELLAGRQPQRIVTVAVIDGGVDTAHAALRSRLWTNPREVAGNGRDDDGNGFVDDIHGWNFIGGKDGKNVNEDTFEVTRLAALCDDSSAAGRARIPATYRTKCGEIQAELAKEVGEARQTLATIAQIEDAFARILPILRRATGNDTLTVERVSALRPTNDTLRQARQIFLNLAQNGITEAELVDAKKAYSSRAQYGYNTSFDPRAIVGDGYPDTTAKHYGNPDVTGPDASHGTHVAGIIGSTRDGGGTGIASNVRLMAIRAVPDGDERDKDVANAIRYAVDNGAHIINMSFGKAFSPYKPLVDEAVKYADSKGVLMVHAAGNDGEDVTQHESFPTPQYTSGGRAMNWIEVGASTWRRPDSLAASFSNYGQTRVDLFAPGEDIYSTMPGGKYKANDGTSMASPVVAGVAALLMSYFPNLTAADVKRIILQSATRHTNQTVARPGESGGFVRFDALSASGGVVNVYEAIKLAEMRP